MCSWEYIYIPNFDFNSLFNKGFKPNYNYFTIGILQLEPSAVAKSYS